MQRRLAKMLEKLNQNIGTQCIISTYSPIFIDEKNITNVYRFNKKNGETQVRIPDKTIGHDESSLIQILKFENAAKIFFVDKIIMVEGEIDAYFFEHYLQYLHNLPNSEGKRKNNKL
jgi:predicted ATP-dependent endonuclease of OLD family